MTSASGTRPGPVTPHPASTPRDVVTRVERFVVRHPVLSVAALDLLGAGSFFLDDLIHPAASWLCTVLIYFVAITLCIPPWMRRRYRASIPKDLRAARLHWRDWAYAATIPTSTPHERDIVTMTSIIVGNEVQREAGRAPVNLRHAHDIARAAVPDGGPIPAAMYGHATYLACAELAAAGWTVKDGIRLAPFDVDENDIRDLFTTIPDLTVEDLRRFTVMTETDPSVQDWETFTERIVSGYAQHGQRASYYVALRFTEAEITAAEHVDFDALRTMDALAP